MLWGWRHTGRRSRIPPTSFTASRLRPGSCPQACGQAPRVDHGGQAPRRRHRHAPASARGDSPGIRHLQREEGRLREGRAQALIEHKRDARGGGRSTPNSPAHRAHATRPLHGASPRRLHAILRTQPCTRAQHAAALARLEQRSIAQLGIRSPRGVPARPIHNTSTTSLTAAP